MKQYRPTKEYSHNRCVVPVHMHEAATMQSEAPTVVVLCEVTIGVHVILHT